MMAPRWQGPAPRTTAELVPTLAPLITFQPHELVVTLLAQLELPAILAQQFLVVGVDLLDGLANLGAHALPSAPLDQLPIPS